MKTTDIPKSSFETNVIYVQEIRGFCSDCYRWHFIFFAILTLRDYTLLTCLLCDSFVSLHLPMASLCYHAVVTIKQRDCHLTTNWAWANVHSLWFVGALS